VLQIAAMACAVLLCERRCFACTVVPKNAYNQVQCTFCTPAASSCVQLVRPLLDLVNATEDEKIASGEESEEEDEEDDMDEQDGAAANGAAKSLAVDNGDDALLLLRALAGQDEEVRAKFKEGENEILGTRCSIM